MDKLDQLIEQHRKFLKSSDHLTDLMVKRAQFGDFDEVDRLGQNRGRLLSILEQLKSKIDSLILEGGLERLRAENNYQLVKQWIEEVSSWSLRTQEKDLEITSILNRLKSETSREISELFKSKQQFKGYNLSSTKR